MDMELYDDRLQFWLKKALAYKEVVFLTKMM